MIIIDAIANSNQQIAAAWFEENIRLDNQPYNANQISTKFGKDNAIKKLKEAIQKCNGENKRFFNWAKKKPHRS